MPPSAHTIRDAFATLRRTQKARHRDIADRLGLSEGELIAAHAGLSHNDASSALRAARLQAHWPDLLASLESVGTVMALTRNASCVHETIGIYRSSTVDGEGIQVQFVYPRWQHGFSVIEQTEHGPQRSLQFFDANGNAIHKVFMKPSSHVDAYAKLVDRFTAPDQTPGIDVAPDAAAAGAETSALRWADPLCAQKIEPAACQSLLLAAATQAVPIAVHVSNAGARQSYAGPIKRVVAMGPWINVLDPTFNLHLREDLIASAWVVKKPTEAGLVTSLELLDKHGVVIATLCGAQEIGMPDLCEWRDLIQNIQQEPRACRV